MNDDGQGRSTSSVCIEESPEEGHNTVAHDSKILTRNLMTNLMRKPRKEQEIPAQRGICWAPLTRSYAWQNVNGRERLGGRKVVSGPSLGLKTVKGAWDRRSRGTLDAPPRCCRRGVIHVMAEWSGWSNSLILRRASSGRLRRRCQVMLQGLATCGTLEGMNGNGERWRGLGRNISLC